MTLRTKASRAFSLAETVMSVVIVGGLVVASLHTVGSATLAQRQMGNSGRGQLLAHDLMTEILQQDYEEPIDTPVLGRESGESGGSRPDYDDVDDYDNWSASPPQYKDGTDMPDLDGWSRSVVVNWVSPSDAKTVVGTETGLKRIEITVKCKGETTAIMSALRAGSRQSTGTGYVPPLGDLTIKTTTGSVQ